MKPWVLGTILDLFFTFFFDQKQQTKWKSHQYHFLRNTQGPGGVWYMILATFCTFRTRTKEMWPRDESAGGLRWKTVNPVQTYHLLQRKTNPNRDNPTTVPNAMPMPTAMRIPGKDSYWFLFIAGPEKLESQQHSRDREKKPMVCIFVIQQNDWGSISLRINKNLAGLSCYVCDQHKFASGRVLLDSDVSSCFKAQLINSQMQNSHTTELGDTGNIATSISHLILFKQKHAHFHFTKEADSLVLRLHKIKNKTKQKTASKRRKQLHEMFSQNECTEEQPKLEPRCATLYVGTSRSYGMEWKKFKRERLQDLFFSA